jgi:hypothetical protein
VHRILNTVFRDAKQPGEQHEGGCLHNRIAP